MLSRLLRTPSASPNLKIVVMMIFRSEMYAAEIEEEEDKPDEEHVAEILIAKHRNGPTGIERLTFLPEYAKFGNYQNPARI